MEKIDVTGKKFGKLTAIKEDTERKGRHRYIVCECDCGNIKSIRKCLLTASKVLSCGCEKYYKKISLIGETFGFLEVVQSAPTKNKQTMWLCKCNCGKFKVVRGSHLRGGEIKSCGCLRGGKRIDLTGHKYGRLLVLQEAPSKRGKTRWLCRCECGISKEIDTKHLLYENGTRSCGCLLKEHNKKHQLEYGEASFNKLFRRYAKGAKERGLQFDLIRDEFEKITKKNVIIAVLFPVAWLVERLTMEIIFIME